MSDEVYLVPNPATPNQAIFIDEKKCTGCNKCVNICRVQTIMPKREVMQFAGDEYSEDVEETEVVDKTPTETPFISNVKVNKTPLGGDGENGRIEVMDGNSLEALLPEVNAPELEEVRGMKTTNGPVAALKKPLKTSSVSKRNSNTRHKETRVRKDRGFSLLSFLIIVFIAIALGSVVGIVAFQLTK